MGQAAESYIANKPEPAAQTVVNTARIGKALSAEAFAAGIVLTDEQLRTLDQMAAGRAPKRAYAILQAIRTKLEYSQPKPAQRHELGGDVVITVRSPLGGSPGSAAIGAKVVLDATGERKSLEGRQGPITAHMSTRENLGTASELEHPQNYVKTDEGPRIVAASVFDL